MKEIQELKKVYDKYAINYFAARSQGKDKSGIYTREIEKPIMFSLVPKNLKNKKLLDIGCGPGIHLKEYLKRKAEAHGVDISKEMLNLAKKIAPKSKLKLINSYKLPFKKNSFDIVTASFLLDHVKDLDKSFKEIKRVLKPKGLFIFSIPHPIRDMFRKKHKKNFTPTHRYFDRTRYYRNIAKTGKKFVVFPRPMQDYIRALLKYKFILKDFIEKGFNKKLKIKYPDLADFYFRIPCTVFFKLEKA